ncbi:MAG: replication-associated recombination protein A [Gracilibacteraceae bacterium]|jgi:putative ATPase|nr:replication-associated recombination protein A [Gracilibacteraceae bacterium]
MYEDPQQSLFDNRESTGPLASRLRPQTLSEFVGQTHLLGEGKVLRHIIESDQASSMIFWGPPGVGKTTLARIIAGQTKAHFINFSAVTSGIKEIKEVMNRAEQSRRVGNKTILFIDEIHRFNKAQQDAFLPYVEKGSIILIGATTENPSFEVNSALLSRCKVFVLQALSPDELVQLLQQALNTPKGFGGQQIQISPEMLGVIAGFANGDARIALSTLEMVILNSESEGGGKRGGKGGGESSEVRITVTPEIIEQCISQKSLLYDKNGEEHYNIISALHKSMRNSDVHAAIYWLARMLEAGEDPLYVARRVTRFASEDIGMADSRALEVAIGAYQACHFIGMPECSVHLAHAVTYMALAPKSNALYLAYEQAKGDAQRMIADPVPLHIRNAPTKLMKDLGYGKGYEYAHDTQDKLTAMRCLPDTLAGRRYYQPTTQGQEVRVKERLEQIEAWHRQHDA